MFKHILQKKLIYIVIIIFILLLSGCSLNNGQTEKTENETNSLIKKTLKKADNVSCKSNLNQLKMAVEVYRAEYGNYPNSLSELEGRSIPKIPDEPAGGQYLYNSQNGLVSCSLGHSLDN